MKEWIKCLITVGTTLTSVFTIEIIFILLEINESILCMTLLGGIISYVSFSLLDDIGDRNFRYIRIPKKLYEDLSYLSTDYINQDNRSTDYPIIFQIREIVEGPAYAGCGEDVFVDDEGRRLETQDEALGLLVEELRNSKNTPIREILEMYGSTDLESIINELNDLSDSGWRSVSVQEVEKFSGFFLTAEACQKHIDANRHHYSSKVDTYAKHAWRNPEMEIIHKFLKEINENKG